MFSAIVAGATNMNLVLERSVLQGRMLVALTTVFLVVTFWRHHFMGDRKPAAWDFWFCSLFQLAVVELLSYWVS